MLGIFVDEAGRNHPTDASQFPNMILFVAVVFAFILAAIALTICKRAAYAMR